MSTGIKERYNYYSLKNDVGTIISKLCEPAESMAVINLLGCQKRFSLGLSLVYNSSSQETQYFGVGARLNFMYSLVYNEILYVTNPDSSVDLLEYSDDEHEFVGFKNGKRAIQLSDHLSINGYVLKLENGDQYYYDVNNLAIPVMIISRDGSKYTTEFQNGKLVGIVRENGLSINFGYDLSNRINEMSVHDGSFLLYELLIIYGANNIIQRVDYIRNTDDDILITLKSANITVDSSLNHSIMIHDNKTNRRIRVQYDDLNKKYTFSEGYNPSFQNGIINTCFIDGDIVKMTNGDDYTDYSFSQGDICFSVDKDKYMSYSLFDGNKRVIKTITRWNVKDTDNLIKDGFADSLISYWSTSYPNALAHIQNEGLFSEMLSANILRVYSGLNESVSFSQRLDYYFKRTDVISVSLFIRRVSTYMLASSCAIMIKEANTIRHVELYTFDDEKKRFIYFECSGATTNNVNLVISIQGPLTIYTFDSIIVRVNNRAYDEEYEYKDGQIIKVYRSNGKVLSRNSFSSNNRVVESIQSYGEYCKTQYNSNLKLFEQNYNKCIDYTYNSSGCLTKRTVETIDGLKLIEENTYVDNMDLANSIDANAFSKNYSYSDNGFRQLTKIEDVNFGSISYEYDGNYGNMKKVKFLARDLSVLGNNKVNYSPTIFDQVATYENANGQKLRLGYDSDNRIISYRAENINTEETLLSYEYMNEGTNLPHYPYIVGKKYGDGSYNKYVFDYNSEYLLNSINYIDSLGDTHLLFSFSHDNLRRLQNVNNDSYIKHYEYKNGLIDKISLECLCAQDGLNYYYGEELELVKEKQRISNSLILYGYNSIYRSINRSIDGLRYYIRHYDVSNSKLYSNFYENKEIYSLSYANENGDDESDKIACSISDGAINSHHYVYNGVGCLKVNNSLGNITYYILPNSSVNNGRVFFNFLIEEISAKTIAKINCGSYYNVEIVIDSVGYLSCRFKNANNSVIGFKTININIMANKWNSFGLSWHYEEGIITFDVFLNKAYGDFSVDITNSIVIHNLELTVNNGDVYYTNVIIGKKWDYEDPLLHKLCSYAEEIMQVRYMDIFNPGKAIASISSTLLYDSSAVDTYFFPLNNDLYNYYGNCLGLITKNEDELLDIDTVGDRNFVYDNKLKHYVLILRKNVIKTNFGVENSGNILARVLTFREDNINKKIFVFSNNFYLYVDRYNYLSLYFYGTQNNTYYTISPEQFNVIGITWMRSISSDSIPIVTYSFKIFVNNNIYTCSVQSNNDITGDNIQIGDNCYLKMEMLFKGSAYLSDASIGEYVNKAKYITVASEYDTLGRQINYNVLKTNNSFYKKKYTYKKNGIYDTLLVESETDSLGNLYEYTYYDNGNLESIKINNTLYRKYYYNYANQLTKEILHNQNYGLEYEYDSVSKNLGGVYIVSSIIGRIPRININYDANGTVNKPLSTLMYGVTYNISYSNDLVTNISSYNGYDYTYQGRKLIGITHNGDTISYHYDEEGNRDKKVINNNITYYYYSNGKLVAEVSNDLNKTIKYLYNENNYLFGFVYNGNIYYYLRDCFGIINGIIDDNNTLVVSYEYDAFGNSLGISGSLANTLGKINPIRYKGYYYDNESGLYYLKNRYYNPGLRLFMQADDISYIDPNYINGYNLYCYCYNNPVMYSDGDGNSPILACFLGLSALVGMGLTIGGVASDNSVLKSIGLSMVAIPALISGGIAVAAGIGGATLTGIVGGATVAAGLGTATFASAEYQHLITGNNWMLDAGMSKDWYNGLMIATASIATFGTIASSFCSAFNINSISQFGKFGDYYGMRFQTGAGKTRVLSLHTHGHRVKHGIRSIFEWHWQLQKWNSLTSQTSGTIASWLIWTLTRM